MGQDFEVWVRWYGRDNEVPEMLISEPDLFIETSNWVPMKQSEYGSWKCTVHGKDHIVPGEFVLKLRQHPIVAEYIETDGHCCVATLGKNQWDSPYGESGHVVMVDDQTSTGVTLIELLEAED